MKPTFLTPLAVIMALGFVPAVHAQTVITGHHDGTIGGNGYDGSGGVFIVPADTNGTPSATFDANTLNTEEGGGGTGLNLGGANVSIWGGEFNGNEADGYYALESPTSVMGGQFKNNLYSGLSVNGAVVTILGGEFMGNGRGLFSTEVSSIIVRGGQFANNTTDFFAAYGGTFSIYGQFDGLTPGQTQTFSNGTGTFVGRLAGDSTPAQTFSYVSIGGSITLHDVAPAPEPSAWAALAVGALGLGALALRTRRRSAA